MMRRVRSLGKGRASTVRFGDEYHRVFALLGRVDWSEKVSETSSGWSLKNVARKGMGLVWGRQRRGPGWHDSI